MHHTRRLKIALWIVGILLLTAVSGLVALSILATRPLIDRDDPLLEQTIINAQRDLNVSRTLIERDTFPIAFETMRIRCIELRAKRSDRWGYQACYDTGTLKLQETRSRGVPLGPRRYWPPLTPLL